jgi:hypothetical protein
MPRAHVKGNARLGESLEPGGLDSDFVSAGHNIDDEVMPRGVCYGGIVVTFGDIG